MTDENAQPSAGLEPHALGPGSPGTEDFWKNIDRQNDTEFLHHFRMSRLHQRNISFAASQFQSQMLGMMLLGESEQPLVPGGSDGPAAEGDAATQPPDPTQPR